MDVLRDISALGHSGEGSGFALIAACSEGERSFEDPSSGHGLFTRFVLEGLSGGAVDGNGQVTVRSLQGYVSRTVAEAAEREFGRRQTPWACFQGLPGNFPALAGSGCRGGRAALWVCHDSRVRLAQLTCLSLPDLSRVLRECRAHVLVLLDTGCSPLGDRR